MSGDEAAVSVGDLFAVVAQALGQVAAALVALTVVGAAAWRLIRPHFRRMVREAAATSEAASVTAEAVQGVPETLRRLDERQGRVEGVLATLSALPERMTAAENRVERESARVDVLQEALLAHITNRERNHT